MLPFSVSALWSSFSQISLSVITLSFHLHLLWVELCCCWDLPNLLWIPLNLFLFLQEVVIKTTKPNFSLFQRQDTAKILSCIFEEFCVESFHAQHMLRFKLRNEYTCSTSFNDSSNEECPSLLHLPVSSSIQTALNSSSRNLVWRQFHLL